MGMNHPLNQWLLWATNGTQHKICLKREIPYYHPLNQVLWDNQAQTVMANGFNREISCHRITTSPISQSFALPPATKPVSHLTCPLPPNHHHHITTLVSHLPCFLPPQSVICLAPCHQISQSFDHQKSHLPCPLPPNQPSHLP